MNRCGVCFSNKLGVSLIGKLADALQWVLSIYKMFLSSASKFVTFMQVYHLYARYSKVFSLIESDGYAIILHVS